MGIEISIKAGADAATSSVSASGTVFHTITDKERKTFGIEDETLNNALEKHFGQGELLRLMTAYLHSPTGRDDDPYQRLGWPEVATVLTVQSATMTGITSEPVIVTTKTFTNNSTKKATFKGSISDKVTNTTESNWSETDTIEVGQKITYEVSFDGAKVGGETSMSYSHSWGQGGSERKETTVGSNSEVSVELNPGESAEAVLTASRGVMKVRIIYNVCLSGAVAAEYADIGNFRTPFREFNINTVMSAAGISNNGTFTEDIEINYYSNSKVELSDPQGKFK